MRPHKRSAANLKRLTRFLDVTREPERSEGSASVRPEPRMNVGVFHLIRHLQFPSRKGGIFRPGKVIKGLRGGVHAYAAQGSPKIDAARAEKGPLRTETTAVNQKFPSCFQDVSMAKKKINDDTLLQLIRDGNSPAEAALFPGGLSRALPRRPAICHLSLITHHSSFTHSPIHPLFFFFRFWLPLLLPLLVAASGCRFAS